MVELDGREVKVGDKMWSFVHGWVEVDKIGEVGFYVTSGDLEKDIPIDRMYYRDGSFFYRNPRCIFWDEVTITPPKPKQKVKKWKWCYNLFDSGHFYIGVTELMTKREATVFCIEARYNLLGRILETEEEVWV